jgi:hypothetical protein
MEDDAIRAVVKRLGRTHPSGGTVIERAAILAEGSLSTDIIAWITAHDGTPETASPVAEAGRGLHAARTSARSASTGATLRFVLPPGALA